MEIQRRELIRACTKLEAKGARLSLFLYHEELLEPDRPALSDMVVTELDDGTVIKWHLGFLCRDDFGYSLDPRKVREVIGFGAD